MKEENKQLNEQMNKKGNFWLDWLLQRKTNVMTETFRQIERTRGREGLAF